MNEERVYLMTRLAIFEEEHKDQLDSARGYFRSDYIGRQMIRTALRTTAAFLLILCGWGMYNVEMLVIDITEIDVWNLVAHILFYYGVLLCIMLLFTYIIHSIRYARAEEDLEYYQKMLKKLSHSYEEEDEKLRARQVMRRG